MSKTTILTCIAIVAGVALSSTLASAAVTFTSLGPEVPGTETLITDFQNANGLTGNYLLLTGSSGNGAAPLLGPGPTGALDSSTYLSVLGNNSATLSLGGAFSNVSLYIGSLDSYNTFTLSNGTSTVSYTGSYLASVTTAIADGGQTSPASNGLFTFTGLGFAVTDVTFASSQNSLEVASVAGGVPETGTWVMMMLGFAGLGIAGYRPLRKRSMLAA